MLSSRLKSSLPRLPQLRLPILRGPLRGYSWVVMSRGKKLRYLLGSYEQPQSDYYRETVGIGDTVVDVGANLGYFTLLFSHLVGPKGRVLAIEPEPQLAYFLRLHVQENGRNNVTVCELAVGEQEGVVTFNNQSGSGRGSVCETSDANGTGNAAEIQVKQQTLDAILHQHKLQPDFVKIDVEGHGGAVIRGGLDTLATCRPKIHFSLHNQAEREAVQLLVNQLGYQVWLDEAGDMVCQPRPLMRAAA